MSPAIDALKRMGATDPVQPGWRGSFALAGYAGVNKPQWITQKRANKGQGPSEFSLTIPLSAGELESMRQDRPCYALFGRGSFQLN